MIALVWIVVEIVIFGVGVLIAVCGAEGVLVVLVTGKDELIFKENLPTAQY